LRDISTEFYFTKICELLYLIPTSGVQYPDSHMDKIRTLSVGSKP